MRFELTLEARHRHGELPKFGSLVARDGSREICEYVGGSSGPYDRAEWRFVRCGDGARATVVADRESPDGHVWEPITKKALYEETGLEPRTVGPEGTYTGSWFTRQRRSPVMRGLVELCLEEGIAVGPHELQALALNEEPGWLSPRWNTTREFGACVADRVEEGVELADAIAAQFDQDLHLAVRTPAMSTAFARDYLSTVSGGPPVDMWSHRGRVAVRPGALLAAAGVAVLLERAEGAVESAQEAIESEIAGARGGQLALV